MTDERSTGTRVRLSDAASPSASAEVGIYVAAPQGSVERARAVAERLGKDGFAIVSRWHAGTENVDDARLSPEEGTDAWGANHADLDQASLVVALTDEHAGRETYAEIGAALDRALPVVWSLEKGGACLSCRAPTVELVDRDADIPRVARALLRGWRSGLQYTLRGVGS